MPGEKPCTRLETQPGFKPCSTLFKPGLSLQLFIHFLDPFYRFRGHGAPEPNPATATQVTSLSQGPCSPTNTKPESTNSHDWKKKENSHKKHAIKRFFFKIYLFIYLLFSSSFSKLHVFRSSLWLTQHFSIYYYLLLVLLTLL